jgi:hypothetical protein
MTAALPSLTYARARPPWYRRASPRRVMFGCLVASTIAGLVWAWKSTPGEWARFIYWQHRCATYSALPDTVVYAANDTAAAATIVNVGGHPSSDFGDEAFASCPERMRMVRYYGPIDPESAIAFLHDRTTPGGEHRLVEVRIGAGDYSNGSFAKTVIDWHLRITAYAPSNHLSRAPCTFSDYDIAPTSMHDPRRIMAVYFFAGQPDPADSTHFTIGYRALRGGVSLQGIIDGRVLNNGSVTLSAINSSLKVSPTVYVPERILILPADSTSGPLGPAF